MKNREIQRLTHKYLVPSLENYVASGQLLIRSPLDLFVCAYCFEGSSFAHDQFTVCAFVQPLYVPRDHIVLSFGKRLGSLAGEPEKWWEINSQNAPVVMNNVLEVIQVQAEPILKLFTTPKSFINSLSKFHVNEKDPYYQEAMRIHFCLRAICCKRGNPLSA